MQVRRPAALALMACALTPVLAGCGGGNGDTVVWGVTTSVQDSGLLDVLVEDFEATSGHHVTPVVGGSGQILEQARRGELDVVMTHSPNDEAAFIEEGFGIEPREVMENYFVVAGPPTDPGGASHAGSIEQALEAVARAKATFISRGDGSGTHTRELETWREIGIDPSGEPWYQESAVSQGQNLLVASDKGAYTIADSSTLISLGDRLDLRWFVVDSARPNVYTVVLVNPYRFPHANAQGARALANYLTGPSGRTVIAAFGQEEFGEALFEPATTALSRP